MEEAMLWHKERNGVRCDLCNWRCFIGKDKKGYCQVRLNKDNKLYSLNYGKIISTNVDPIEKKPLFHFHPGEKTFSIASPGCNFRCQFCCNAELSQGIHETPIEKMKIPDYTPEQIIKLAEKNKTRIISYTYSEPTIFFEFAFKAAKLASRSNMFNTFVTNGYMTSDAVKKIKYLDAATVDVKASLDPEFYKKFMSVPKPETILATLKQMKKQRIHIEITNLIVPQFGDSVELCKKFAEWVNAELGSEVPFHVLQFFPSYKLLDLPSTPIATLEKCIDVARKAGLRYVYIGNVPEHADESTYCYNCKEKLIFRKGMSVKKMNLVDDRCPNCGVRINIVVK